MSVAWNLDVAMQMSSVLVAGRGCTCCAPRLAVGLASGALTAGPPARGRCEQSTVFIPPRTSQLAVTDRSYRPQHSLFWFTHRRILAAYLTRSQTPSRHLPCCFHRHAWNVPCLRRVGCVLRT